MRKLLPLLMIWVLGAAIMAPIVTALEPDPLPWDFVLSWDSYHYHVHVFWSLCASVALALFYLFYRR